jgi:hypothetical protein
VFHAHLYIKMTKTEILYKKKETIKKKQQADLRRFLRGQATPNNLRNWIGLNQTELKILLESRMQPSMDWKNYGKHWQVDHVAPFWIFDLENEKDLKLLWHPDNLMPLIGKDNNHKQGDLRFSLILLHGAKKWSRQIEMLIEKVEKEIKVQDKYYKAYLDGKYYDPLK